jgi:hypothetical protein
MDDICGLIGDTLLLKGQWNKKNNGGPLINGGSEVR